MAFAELHDTIVLAPGERLTLKIDGPFAGGLSDGPDNLVHRAARRLAEAAGRSPDVAILLCKRLPIAAGIGGGSADAAAVLAALSERWGMAADRPEVVEIAHDLGADVPICLAGRAARVGGIGEMVETFASLPDCGLVLVNPGVPLATPRVFAARRGAFSGRAEIPHWPETADELAGLLRRTRNDLTEPAIALVPEIAEVLGALQKVPGCLLARMSGSGATCFGLFDDEEKAQRASARLAAAHPAWWVRASRLVSCVKAVRPA